MLNIQLQASKGDFLIDVDLCLPAQGTTAIFGPSGSGKTSLLRAIAGLDKSQGFLKIGQHIWQNNYTTVPTHQRPLAYIFQENNLLPHLSVEKNLSFALKRVPKSEQKISIDEAVNFFGIRHLLRRSVPNLSGGERQRIALARALLLSPKLLLMDEPLSALDSDGKLIVLRQLEKLQDKLNIPTIFVTHSKSEIMRLANFLVLMRKGRIESYGPLNEMITRMDLPLNQAKDAGVVIETKVINHDKNFFLTQLKFSGGLFSVPFQNIPLGARLRLLISAQDVSICLSPQKDTSILNIFPAIIQELSCKDQKEVVVKLNVSGTFFLSRISRKSLKNLNLRKGKKVFVQIKATALSME